MNVQTNSREERLKVKRQRPQRLSVSSRREDNSYGKKSSDMPVFPNFPQVNKIQLPSGHKRSSEDNMNYPIHLLSKIAQLVSLSWNS